MQHNIAVRTITAALVSIAYLSFTAPPLSGLAALALTLGVAALVVVARAEAVAQ